MIILQFSFSLECKCFKTSLFARRFVFNVYLGFHNRLLLMKFKLGDVEIQRRHLFMTRLLISVGDRIMS